jgi:hypothetical protein
MAKKRKRKAARAEPWRVAIAAKLAKRVRAHARRARVGPVKWVRQLITAALDLNAAGVIASSVTFKRKKATKRDGESLVRKSLASVLRKLPERERVRLADVRRRLRSMSRAEQDAALIEAQLAGAIVLYRIDDPMDITAADEAAAVSVAGQPRHILYRT